MKLELKAVKLEEKEILKNLLEKYDYEFSQYDKRDVNPLGLYGYEYLDHYWTDENRWAYFIVADNQLAGFVMINDYSEVKGEIDYSMAEFFVMYKYRRSGVGRYAALKTFERFRGKWHLILHPKNQASVNFWNRMITEHTNGDFQLTKGHRDAEYEDGTFGDVFLFDNGKKN